METQIAGLDSILLRMPLDARWAAHGMTELEVVHVTLTDDDGATGTGFTFSLSGGARAMRALVDGVIGEAVVGTRGDVRVDGRTFRFVNTHLESELSDIAYAQAEELLAGPAATDRPVVLVCDCNSDPLDDSVKPGEVHAHRDPYLLLTGDGGFADTWLRVARAEQGWTAGLSELVNDTPEQAAERFDHRVDFVLARGRGRRDDAGPARQDGRSRPRRAHDGDAERAAVAVRPRGRGDPPAAVGP